MKSRPLRLSLLAAVALSFAAPAMAQSGPPPGMPPMGAVDAAGHYYEAGADPRPEWRPEWQRDPAAIPQPQMRGGYDRAGYEQSRADWLGECRRNHGNGSTVGGAVIGGLVGGVIGNRVAGRGNRTVGTIAGAAVGAVAGGAIGSAADRRNARDYCESYLDNYSGQQGGYGYAQPGYGYGYQPMMVMVPVMMVTPGGGQRECTTTVVTEEYVTVVPRAVRVRALRLVRPPRPVSWRAAPVPDKRVRTN